MLAGSSTGRARDFGSLGCAFEPHPAFQGFMFELIVRNADTNEETVLGAFMDDYASKHAPTQFLELQRYLCTGAYRAIICEQCLEYFKSNEDVSL